MLVEQPATPEAFHEVRTFQELKSAIDADGPRLIRLLSDIELSEMVTIGGFTGNTAARTGTDLTIDLNGFKTTREGFTISQACNRIRFENGSIFTGERQAADGLAKWQMPDPISITGNSEVVPPKPPASNITFSRVSFGFGTDINFHSEGDKIWLDRCFSFWGVGTPKNPKHSDTLPHSKASLFRNVFPQRLTVYVTQSAFGMCDDRTPRASGSIDVHLYDSIGQSRMGFSLEDAHDGTLNVNASGNYFLTGRRYFQTDPRFLPSKAGTFYLRNSCTNVYMADNWIDSEFYGTTAEIFASGGIQFPGADNPASNVMSIEPPITCDYQPMSEIDKFNRILDNAGNPYNCPQTSAARDMLRDIKADPETIYRILSSETEQNLY